MIEKCVHAIICCIIGTLIAVGVGGIIFLPLGMIFPNLQETNPPDWALAIWLMFCTSIATMQWVGTRSARNNH